MKTIKNPLVVIYEASDCCGAEPTEAWPSELQRCSDCLENCTFGTIYAAY